MQIAKRIYSLAQEQNDPALMIGAYRRFGSTLYFLGDFEAARQYATHGLQIWRSGGIRLSVQEVERARRRLSDTIRRCPSGISERSPLADATMAEAISLAKELNDMHGLAVALYYAAHLAHYERNPAEAERLASDLIELSTRRNFALWLAVGEVFRGWARSASGNTAEGLSWIEDGIRDFRATGSMLCHAIFSSTKG